MKAPCIVFMKIFLVQLCTLKLKKLFYLSIRELICYMALSEDVICNKIFNFSQLSYTIKYTTYIIYGIKLYL
jgi:hypothetical protein